MRREQAVRINDRLLDACAALDRARVAIADLGKAERIELDDRLEEVLGTLEDELLQPIYDQHPDLKPPRPDRESNSDVCELTWDEVQLPPGVTEQQFDEIIFSVMKPTWRKTAMMVIYVMDRCKELGLAIEGQVIAARLKVLSDSDRIEGIGNIQSWLHSEVRLKD
ncbi:hypothetical protein JQ617_21210 [Bradyrhizobium sp. KB893862 SZCCT0404]|uniref:hypothetical protein n=1 Tax=Bradyrhizobium sp. KB893862 SZCCT0404 TaxID=2807672 RepID=UPI001BA649BB|nr:hypothetical protein [Bradyrhizobium sp. KB893862 SZCCT0404]MBR1176487.1 hypothetical protein [Bradyrhizobium sp. KB893862 SZCCT0404]